ncbi:MAG: thioredoxin family protein [Planctomycetota bacterium]|nr:thioredoxin family protein [Planctomycetota bacterium]
MVEPAATSPAATRPHATTITLVFAVCGLSGLSFLLARQNRDLKAQIARLTPPPVTLPAGTPLAPLALIDAAGVAKSLDLASDRATLVIAVGMGCGYCVQTAPQYREALAAASADRLRVVWVLLDATKPEDLAHEAATLGEPSLVFARDARTTWLRQINITPSAVLIDKAGHVIKAWPGVLDDESLRDLRLALIDAAG